MFPEKPFHGRVFVKEFETEEGKKLLKEWGVSENYVGIGHCILGYADGELHPPIKRKEDYIRYVK